MPARLSPLFPLKILAVRALVGYVLLRLLLVVVAALMAEFAGRGPADSLQSPTGVVLIAAGVGYIDVRRRGESMLWANLGFAGWTAPALFATAAVVGELALAALRR
jgi:hypothetical protein